MKKYFFGLLGILACFAVEAQVKTVLLNVYGHFEAAVSDRKVRVTVNEQGELTHIGMDGKMEYYPSGTFRNRKIAWVGDIAFKYYPENDSQGRGGKVAQVGEVVFEYYDRNDAFGRDGMLSMIGRIPIDYFARNDQFGRGGRVSRIGECQADYYFSGDARGRSGKLRQLGSETYDYFPDNVPGNRGRLMSGAPRLTEYGIEFRIIR